MRSRADSEHPGTPMALALLVYARWTRVMRFDPQDPVWPNCDVHLRVVAMPSGDIFEHQPKEYRAGVLPPAITARVAIEQASAFGWERYLGSPRRHRNERHHTTIVSVGSA